ncbi:hypothetical protein [Algoriphagus marinus]|uniref:hypothetical protein n=1 Tax=Algoriphagus marinus TaxID=1925762 RepID=UPI000B00372D|nr:hypothetical protein [Algoriphagus marinus]
MFFYLSQFLSFLAMPFTIICILILVGAIYLNKKWRKRSLWMGMVLLFLQILRE